MNDRPRHRTLEAIGMLDPAGVSWYLARPKGVKARLQPIWVSNGAPPASIRAVYDLMSGRFATREECLAALEGNGEGEPRMNEREHRDITRNATQAHEAPGKTDPSKGSWYLAWRKGHPTPDTWPIWVSDAVPLEGVRDVYELHAGPFRTERDALQYAALHGPNPRPAPAAKPGGRRGEWYVGWGRDMNRTLFAPEAIFVSEDLRQSEIDQRFHIHSGPYASEEIARQAAEKVAPPAEKTLPRVAANEKRLAEMQFQMESWGRAAEPFWCVARRADPPFDLEVVRVGTDLDRKIVARNYRVLSGPYVFAHQAAARVEGLLAEESAPDPSDPMLLSGRVASLADYLDFGDRAMFVLAWAADDNGLVLTGVIKTVESELGRLTLKVRTVMESLFPGKHVLARHRGKTYLVPANPFRPGPGARTITVDAADVDLGE